MSNVSVEAILRDRFGHDALYPLQKRIIERLLGGRDALVVLPTGSGKSLCYQLPALAIDGPGTTLVFSPLIALMEDQVAALKKRAVRAEYVNSTLTRRERERRYAALAAGDYDLIYATPERMYKPEFVNALERVDGGVRLLAVDEAHCITKWGHDFRPAYQEVGRFREQLGDPPTVALTATATPAVRQDIRDTLRLDEDRMPLFASGLDRPNLSLAVKEVWGDGDKVAAIRQVAEVGGGTGIVYFSLIKTLDHLAHELRHAWGRDRGAIYHGRLDPGEKKRVHDRFAASRPEDRLMLLATNAFGMGVDKPDIRYIVHAQIPGSVEAYYQEVGRAGRDGTSSRCVLLYDESDLAIQQEFVEWMNPSADLLRDAAATFAADSRTDLDVDELRERIIGRNRGDRRAEYCLIALEKLGVIQPHPGKERFRFVRRLDDDQIVPEELAAKRGRDLRRLLDMVELVKSEDIRRFVLEYFGLDGTGESR